MLKKNDLAYVAYKNLCPIYNGMKPDEYVAEPYVTTGNIDGPDSPNYGMGGWTWYTRSAAWYQKVIVDWILGVRATKNGLVVDPCVPKDWNEFSVKRLFRGTVYNIKVFKKSNSDKSNSSYYIIIDGKKVEGNLIPLTKKTSVHVEVFI